MMAKVELFKKENNGFNYRYKRKLQPGETVIVRMPAVSSNKRGVNDIGWQSDGDVTLFGTLSTPVDAKDAMWQEIGDAAEINKTVSGIKIVNNSATDSCTVYIRAILC